MKNTKLEQKKYDRENTKHAAIHEAKKNQRPVKEITISIEWKKSRVWNSNPHATADVTYSKPNSSGSMFERAEGFACSGCGYDKESTVIAQVFNRFLSYKLYGKIKKLQKHWDKETGKTSKVYPYGISIRKHKAWVKDTGEKIGPREYRYFDGGIGTNCYYDISKAIGGKFEKIASGKAFDVYKYTDNQ